MLQFDPDMDPTDCEELWRRLLDGECKLVGAFTTSSHAYLSLADEVESGRTPPLTPRMRRALEGILSGRSAKVVALDLGLSDSTLAGEIRQSLFALGYIGTTSTVPLGLVMLLRATRSLIPFELMSEGDPAARPRRYTVSAAIPKLDGLLPPAVLEVVQFQIQGESHAQIAARRRTSRRTVANQLATAFKRLRISGRGELLGYLAAVAAPVSDPLHENKWVPDRDAFVSNGDSHSKFTHQDIHG